MHRMKREVVLFDVEAHGINGAARAVERGRDRCAIMDVRAYGLRRGAAIGKQGCDALGMAGGRTHISSVPEQMPDDAPAEKTGAAEYDERGVCHRALLVGQPGGKADVPRGFGSDFAIN